MNKKYVWIAVGVAGIWLIGKIGGKSHTGWGNDDKLHVVTGHPVPGQPFVVSYNGKQYALTCTEHSVIRPMTFVPVRKRGCDLDEAESLTVYAGDSDEANLELSRHVKRMESLAALDEKNAELTISVVHNPKTTKMLSDMQSFRFREQNASVTSP